MAHITHAPTLALHSRMQRGRHAHAAGDWGLGTRGLGTNKNKAMGRGASKEAVGGMKRVQSASVPSLRAPRGASRRRGRAAAALLAATAICARRCRRRSRSSSRLGLLCVQGVLPERRQAHDAERLHVRGGQQHGRCSACALGLCPPSGQGVGVDNRGRRKSHQGASNPLAYRLHALASAHCFRPLPPKQGAPDPLEAAHLEAHRHHLSPGCKEVGKVKGAKCLANNSLHVALPCTRTSSPAQIESSARLTHRPPDVAPSSQGTPRVWATTGRCPSRP